MRARCWLVVGLSLACGPRPIGQDDDVAESSSEIDGDGDGDDSSSSESSTSDADTTTTESSTESSTESDDTESSTDTGPLPDLPDDLPEDCEPVNFLEKDGNQPTDVWSGWVVCQGSFFRIQPIDCVNPGSFELCEDPGGCEGCDPSEECLDYYGNGSGICFCGNNCAADSDCGDNEICACASGLLGDPLASRNTCLPADCAGQTDCPVVADETVPRCRLGHDLCGGPNGVHCRTDVDSCIHDDECPNYWCRYDPGDELWSCDEPAICE